MSTNDMHGITSWVKASYQHRLTAKLSDTMLFATDTRNLSVVVLWPIPWYGFLYRSATRSCETVSRTARFTF
jgi:hypothetical protein